MCVCVKFAAAFINAQQKLGGGAHTKKLESDCRKEGALTLKLQSCISIMTSQPKADQNLREVGGERWGVTNHRNKKQKQWMQRRKWSRVLEAGKHHHHLFILHLHQIKIWILQEKKHRWRNKWKQRHGEHTNIAQVEQTDRLNTVTTHTTKITFHVHLQMFTWSVFLQRRSKPTNINKKSLSVVFCVFTGMKSDASRESRPENMKLQ